MNFREWEEGGLGGIYKDTGGTRLPTARSNGDSTSTTTNGAVNSGIDLNFLLDSFEKLDSAFTDSSYSSNPSASMSEQKTAAGHASDLLLQTIREEISTIRHEINHLSKSINSFECSSNFNGSDPRYHRWVTTKKLLQDNLHEILKTLVSSANLNKLSPANEDSLQQNNPRISFLRDATKILPVGGITGDEGEKKVSAHIEELAAAEMKSDVGTQLHAYKLKKEELAQIMRGFSEQRIHFKALDDGSNVYVRQYQILKNEGKPMEECLRGKLLNFRVGINKKINQYTEVKLFVPEFESN